MKHNCERCGRFRVCFNWPCNYMQDVERYYLHTLQIKRYCMACAVQLGLRKVPDNTLIDTNKAEG